MDNDMVIIPTHKALSSINNSLACTEPDCDATFKCSSNLTMHLMKRHKKNINLGTHISGWKYYCPFKNCKYNIEAKNKSIFFSKFKYLKQHYVKCHIPKLLKCELCKKGFPTEAILLAHSKTCGKKYVCSCNWSYISKEALMTHCKRKGHSPSKKENSPEISSCDMKDDVEENTKSGGKKYVCSCKWSYISKEALMAHCKRKGHTPSINENSSELSTGDLKDSVEENTLLQLRIGNSHHSKSPRKQVHDVAVFPTHYVAAIALSELSTTLIIPKICHIGVQTVETKQIKKNRAEKNVKNTQETQTAACSRIAKIKFSAETQTSGDLQHKPECRKRSRNRKRSTETQTKDLMPFLSSVNSESLDGGIFNESSLSNSSSNNDKKIEMQMDIDYDAVWNHKKITSRSQIYMNSIVKTENSYDKLCNNETQTDVEFLFPSHSEGTSTIETQTTDDLIEDLYSNMCTQTCSETCDLFDFNFVDIETQTAWPDL